MDAAPASSRAGAESLRERYSMGVGSRAPVLIQGAVPSIGCGSQSQVLSVYHERRKDGADDERQRRKQEVDAKTLKTLPAHRTRGETDGIRRRSSAF